MQAITYRCYGPPAVLKLERVPKPVVADDAVLVRVRAASLNPLDWHYMRGTPYLLRLEAGIGRPSEARMGVDFAGSVEAVGRNVTRYKVGDEVFGGRDGAFAEYVSVRESRALAHKPANMSFAQAAAVPIAGITALQALRDKGHIHAGEKVLINGASGGVGTFAVQIAKSYGAEVTGVCSTTNVPLVRALGADHVIDYTRDDFTRGGEQYDLILDNVGNRPLLAYRRVMTPNGILVMVGGGRSGDWIGFMIAPLEGLVLSRLGSRKFEPFLAELNKEDLAFLGDLMQQGKLTPFVDRSYSLARLPEAMTYLEAGHARGKVVVTIP
ncbi:MAG: NAD(P)-dependent alcohol dehydrogenase [Gammaproteobacteria bacterium]|nr:NAD(P)-dependent alcohol dehydrogenase [Gammaproteobacteria bacterium]